MSTDERAIYMTDEQFEILIESLNDISSCLEGISNRLEDNGRWISGDLSNLTEALEEKKPRRKK